MRALAIICALAAPAAAEEAILVPSGADVILAEVLRDAAGPMGLTYRFRFVAPEIARLDADFELVAQDMQALCDDYALPRVTSSVPLPSQLIVSVADQDIPFGFDDPEVVQFFEGFTIGPDDTCIVEFF